MVMLPGSGPGLITKRERRAEVGVGWEGVADLGAAVGGEGPEAEAEEPERPKRRKWRSLSSFPRRDLIDSSVGKARERRSSVASSPLSSAGKK